MPDSAGVQAGDTLVGFETARACCGGVATAARRNRRPAQPLPGELGVLGHRLEVRGKTHERLAGLAEYRLELAAHDLHKRVTGRGRSVCRRPIDACEDAAGLVALDLVYA